MKNGMPHWAVRVGQECFDVPQGTKYREIAERVQPQYPHPIFLVKNQNGKLCELNKQIAEDCSLTMVTADEKPGYQSYERSALLLMLKAFYDVVGRDHIDRLKVEFSLSRALFITAKGDFSLNQALLDQVEAGMRRLSDLALPIEKRNVSKEEAVRCFHKNRMFEKERLLRFRRSSRINIYSLAGFEDYFYGYMLPDTSYIRVFRLECYGEGFILRLPAPEQPERLGAFTPSKKVFSEMYRTANKLTHIGLDTVASLNERIAAGETKELILCEEALMEKQIGDIAQQIAAQRSLRFVMIAGPSSSGKTTFSRRLCTQLRAHGRKPHPIEVDNYFKNRIDTPRDANGQLDFEGLSAMDVELFNAHMTRLLRGEKIELPRFNFVTGEREYHGDVLSFGEEDILVIEGIHCLNEELSYAIPSADKFRIYISCLTQMNIDEHNRISTTDARLLRRMIRDARTRGADARETLRRWPSVGRGERINIFPHQDKADVIFNSALLYETAVMKPYAEALLFGIPESAPEYVEANRLLKFLNYFLAVPAESVPGTSIIREFIGGGSYLV